jgi:hypothetical protein
MSLLSEQFTEALHTTHNLPILLLPKIRARLVIIGRLSHVTLPHSLTCEEVVTVPLEPTNSFSVFQEEISCGGLRHDVCWLVLCLDGPDDYQAFLEKGSKMVLNQIYVLGAGSHLVRPCYFQGSTVVFKRLAVYFGHVAVIGDVLVIHLPYHLHQGNRLTQRL